MIFFCPSLLTELQFSHIFLHPKTTKFTVITLQHIIDVHEIFLSYHRMPFSLLMNHFNTSATRIVEGLIQPHWHQRVSLCWFQGNTRAVNLFIDCEGNQWVPKKLLEIQDCLSMSTIKCPPGSQSYCSAISIFLTLTSRHPSLSQASRNNSWFLFAKLDWTMAFSLQNLSCSAWRKNCFELYYCFKSIKTLLYVDNNLSQQDHGAFCTHLLCLTMPLVSRKWSFMQFFTIAH